MRADCLLAQYEAFLRRIATVAPGTWMGREASWLLTAPYGHCGCGAEKDEHGCPHGH